MKWTLIRSRTLAVVLAGFILLAGCSSGTQSPTQGPAKQKPKQVVVALTADIPNLHPALTMEATLLMQVLPNIYDPLFRRDGENRVKPHLAESYQMVDEKTWEITLRQGVKFHNGEPFDAESVKYTLDFILDPANKAQGRTYIAQVEKVEVLAPNKVRIKTAVAMPTLIPQLTEIYMAPAKYAKEKGTDGLATMPVGTGPFKLGQWTKGGDIVLEANADYWKGKPEIDRLILRPIPEAAARVAALLSGDVQVAINVPPHMVKQIQQGGHQVLSVAGRRVIYMGMDTIHPGPLQNPKVRQAINHAVDVDMIIKQILEGYATRMPGPLPVVNEDVASDLQPYKYDPELAKKLLAEAGYPQGFKVPMFTPSGRYMNDKEVAEAIAAQLRKVNIQVDFQVTEWGAYLEMVRANAAPGVGLHLLGRSDRLYEGTILNSWFLTGATYVTYSKPALDEKLKAAATTADVAKRGQTYRSLQKEIWEEAPWLFLYSQHDLYAVANGLQWKPRSDELVIGGEMKYVN